MSRLISVFTLEVPLWYVTQSMPLGANSSFNIGSCASNSVRFETNTWMASTIQHESLRRMVPMGNSPIRVRYPSGGLTSRNLMPGLMNNFWGIDLSDILSPKL